MGAAVRLGEHGDGVDEGSDRHRLDVLGPPVVLRGRLTVGDDQIDVATPARVGVVAVDEIGQARNPPSARLVGDQQVERLTAVEQHQIRFEAIMRIVFDDFLPRWNDRAIPQTL
jgi:hypothetical protein